MIKRPLLAALFLLHPLTVCVMNLPTAAWSAPVLRMVFQPLAHYASLTGLESRWQMYSTLPTSNWHFIISARYPDGTRSKLPLPRQNPRTAWQRSFFDLKEYKFHLYLLNDATAKRAYARYLCRTYPAPDGAPAAEIVWETEWQQIVAQDQAAWHGGHMHPVPTTTAETFPCGPMPLSPA